MSKIESFSVRVPEETYLGLQKLAEATGLKIVDLSRIALDGLLDYAKAHDGRLPLPIRFASPETAIAKRVDQLIFDMRGVAEKTAEILSDRFFGDLYQRPQESSIRPVEFGAASHVLPFLGAVAAGEPVEAPRNETLPVPKEYEPGHFVVEINGRSGEPKFHDGERWIVDGRNCYTPKSGKPCIVSDGSGSYLKKWNRKSGVFEPINPEFPDVIPGEEAKLQGYPVEKLE